MLKRAFVAFLMVGLPARAQTAPENTGDQPEMCQVPCPPQQVEVPAPPPMAQPAPPPPYEAAQPVTHREHKHNRVFAPMEFALTTGAGPANYFGSSNTMRTDVGAVWDVRATFGAHSIFALEAAYMGASNTVEQNGVHNGNIMSNGIDSDLRIQLPTRVQPYIFGGVGYNHMALHNAVITQNQTTDDNQVTVPAGAGVSAYVFTHATLDLRGTYRYIGDNQMQTVGGEHTVSHQWLAQARLGYAF